MRYVIVGAGAVGVALGGLLHTSGADVAFVVRDHAQAALAERGLQLVRPRARTTMRVPVFTHPSEASISSGDAVVLAVKSQDTVGAIAALAGCVHPDTPVVCAQNGVENERVAARCFENVYASTVTVPVTYVDPGEVVLHADPVPGIVDLGRFPSGIDDFALRTAGDLSAAGFRSTAVTDAMEWKLAKLLLNLANVLDAAGGADAAGSDLAAEARDEAIACYQAAGLSAVDPDRESERRADLRLGDIATYGSIGSSTTQSLRRGSRLETDYLNGEIALLGRLYDVPTPVNSGLQTLARWLHDNAAQPRSLSVDEIRALVDRP